MSVVPTSRLVRHWEIHRRLHFQRPRIRHRLVDMEVWNRWFELEHDLLQPSYYAAKPPGKEGTDAGSNTHETEADTAVDALVKQEEGGRGPPGHDAAHVGHQDMCKM
jgi:hypothetical protein